MWHFLQVKIYFLRIIIKYLLLSYVGGQLIKSPQLTQLHVCALWEEAWEEEHARSTQEGIEPVGRSEPESF